MSEPTAPENSCPKCGATLPSTATGGLCPRCLMAEAMAPTETDAGLVAHPPLPPEQIAPHFPQLEILECLGRGGMGVVYKARQKTLNRFVALKLLAPERVLDPQFAERFTREAQALAALNHPNIITIHDFGQAGGFYYLLMEFVDGANLRQLLRARKFTPEEALTIVPPLCDALQFAHERGIIHRDIKPENLLLDKAGRVKVADFGIAKILGTAGANDDAGPSSGLQNATQTGMGTPGYSAPEQKTDPQHVDSRADIYSLGVVFYELLTGELPGKRIEPPSHKVHIDVRLDEVVLRTLEQAPERRYQQASEVKTMLETIVQSPSPPVPPSPPAGGPNPISIKPKSKTMKTAITAIVVSAGALLVAGIAVCLFLTGDETIHIRSIPRDWSCLSGDASQWDWNDNTIYGHSTNGDSILASTKQYGDVTLSAMVSTTNREASLALRMQDADDGYVVIFGPDGTPTASWNGGHVWLIKRKSGNERQLAMFNRRGLSAPGEREKLTVIAKGSWIEVRLNDVTIIRTNDATFKAGYIGLRVYGDSTYGCDGVFSNLTVRAKWLELRGGVETRPREITDEESRGTGSQTVTDREIIPPVKEISTDTQTQTNNANESAAGAQRQSQDANWAAMKMATTFGPVIERTIYDYKSGKDWLLNLATCETYSLPEGIGWNTSPAAVWDWMHQHGIHIIGHTAFDKYLHEGDPNPVIQTLEPGYGFPVASETAVYGFEINAAIVDENGTTFETITPGQISSALEKQVSHPKKSPKQGPWLLQLATMTGLYAFQTEDGQSGVLQITAFTENPSGVKIRYKMVLPPIFTGPAGLGRLKEKFQTGEHYVKDYEFKQDTAILLQGRTNTVDEAVTEAYRLGHTVIQETPGGGHELELEILSARMGVRMGDVTMLDYDSAAPSAADQTNGAAVFKEIVGYKFHSFLDAGNDPTRLEGVEELIQRIQSVPKKADSLGLKNYFNAAYFEALTNSYSFLPRHPVQPGDAWSSHVENPAPGTGIAAWDYHVVFQSWEMHVGLRCARLELKGILNIKPDPNSKRDETTYRARDGVMEGVAWFYPDIGQMIETDLENDITVEKEPRNPDGTFEEGQSITTQRRQVITERLEIDRQ